MVDSCLAFLGSVAEKIDGVFIKEFLIGLFLYNVRLDWSDAFQTSVVDTCIYLHPPGIKHRTEQCVLFWNLSKQDGYTQQL